MRGCCAGRITRRTPLGEPAEDSHAGKVHCSAHGGGAVDVPRGRSEVSRRRREGAAGADSVAGRRRRAGVDGLADRGGALVPEADGGEYPSALRVGRLRGRAGAQASRDAPGGEAARRRAGGASDRAAPGRAAVGPSALVAAAVGAARRGVGDRRVGESRDRSADVKKTASPDARSRTG